MEPQPAPAAPGVLARLSSHLDWYWMLSPPGRTAFWATFGGWALDAYNQMTLGFVLPAVTAAFALSTTQAGLLGTVGLVTSAVGGAMVGAPIPVTEVLWTTIAGARLRLDPDQTRRLMESFVTLLVGLTATGANTGSAISAHGRARLSRA
jgi:hypothetical protein